MVVVLSYTNNIFVSYGDLTFLSWFLICAVPIFTLQLLLCFKSKKLSVKVVPLYLLIICGIIGVLEYTGLFGQQISSGIAWNDWYGLIILAAVILAFIGMILAWFVYGLASLKRKNHTKETV